MIIRPLTLPFFTRSVPVRTRHPTPRRRGARRTLLVCAMIALLINCVLAVVVETILPQALDPEYGYLPPRAAELQRTSPTRPLVLALGSSRTQNALDPGAMGFPDNPGTPLVVNAGQPGAWAVSLRLSYHRHRTAGARPAAVLVELFPGTLDLVGPTETLLSKAAGYSDCTAAELRLVEPYLSEPGALTGHWALCRVTSLRALRPAVLSCLGPKWQPLADTSHRRMVEQFGFVPSPYETLAADVRERKRADAQRAYAAALRNLTVSELCDRAYRDLVADCRAAGTPVAFFMTPESPVFRSWYTPQSRAAVAAYARVLSDELGCPVFATPLDFAEEDFADGHHMLSGAARRFSRQLADDHLKPWLTQVLK